MDGRANGPTLLLKRLAAPTNAPGFPPIIMRYVRSNSRIQKWKAQRLLKQIKEWLLIVIGYILVKETVINFDKLSIFCLVAQVSSSVGSEMRTVQTLLL